MVEICVPLPCSDPAGADASGLSLPAFGPALAGSLVAEGPCDYRGRPEEAPCRLRMIGSIGPVPGVGGAWCGAFRATGAIELIAGEDRFFGEMEWRHGPFAGVIEGVQRDGTVLRGVARIRTSPATGDCGVTAPTDRFVLDATFLF